MTIATEPIGSIPRPAELQQGMQAYAAGTISQGEVDALARDTALAKIQARIDGTRFAEIELGL